MDTTTTEEKIRIIILYGTTTGTSKRFAINVKEFLEGNESRYNIFVEDFLNYDEENLSKQDVVILLCSTWIDGKPTESMERFLLWLDDLDNDFRVAKTHFSSIHFAVLGFGSMLYTDKFCLPAIKVYNVMTSLSATPIAPLTLLDDQVEVEESIEIWKISISNFLRNFCKEKYDDSDKTVFTFTSKNIADSINARHIIKKSKASENQEPNDSNDEVELEEEDLINNRYVDSDSDDGDENNIDPYVQNGHNNITKSSLDSCGSPTSHENPRTGGYSRKQSSDLDLEDLGLAIKSSSLATNGHNGLASATTDIIPREMVTNLQRKALTKEGYKIIGSHSAVKLCRWTKNQLRGRGGCYKHTFYGITSYQCMEATPSLACANKCVFCWRHHKNPVGKEWRWKTDEPDFIVREAVEQHQRMINQMRGVPGVQTDRLQEAFTVKHCALSLVGEPIMYPRINEMLRELHARGISSFLVTNAQFPESIAALDPVTQLYVSVDAASRDALKAVDRPLFKDFWERFQASLHELSKKRQRTVYRMTLVKSWNMAEIDGYVELIEKGLPDFIEIKAVTYCGKSDASSLTMQNVPWHYEVCAYAEMIVNRLQERGVVGVRYGIATEHEHSCCLLLAREDKFLLDGVWHTWINYPEYNRLIERYYSSKGEEQFTSVDYMAQTPSWALYKSTEKGFDPDESRWRRNKKGEVVEADYKPSGSGCG